VIYYFNVAENADVLQLCRLSIKTNKKRGIVDVTVFHWMFALLSIFIFPAFNRYSLVKLLTKARKKHTGVVKISFLNFLHDVMV